MKSKKEIKEWLLKNCIDKDGDLDLRGLDFSDFNGDIFISGMKAQGNLFQSLQEVKGELLQHSQTVKGNLKQDYHKVQGNLHQGFQEVKGDLHQSHQEVHGKLVQDDQEVEGEKFQSFQKLLELGYKQEDYGSLNDDLLTALKLKDLGETLLYEDFMEHYDMFDEEESKVGKCDVIVKLSDGDLSYRYKFVFTPCNPTASLEELASMKIYARDVVHLESCDFDDEEFLDWEDDDSMKYQAELAISKAWPESINSLTLDINPKGDKQLIIEQTWQEKYKEYLMDRNVIHSWDLRNIIDLWIIDEYVYILKTDSHRLIKDINCPLDFFYCRYETKGIKLTAFNSQWKEKPKGDK